MLCAFQKVLTNHNKCLQEASTKFGKRLNVASEQKQKMKDAGFVEVGQKTVNVSSFLLKHISLLDFD